MANNNKIAALAGTVLLAATGMAQDSDNLTVELGECVDLESADERFACYERRVERARLEQQRDETAAATPRAAAPEAPAAEPRAPAATSRQARVEPGFDSRDGEPEPVVDFSGVIAELRETVPNSHLITLENGQVWRQTLPKFYPLRDGQQVRIYEGRLGYRLAAEEFNGFIRVERVR